MNALKDRPSSPDSERNANPLTRFCSAIQNIMSWVNGNAELKIWPRFSIEDLVSCFKGAKKESFLTERPLAQKLIEFKSNQDSLRSSIPSGTRLTAAVAPCFDEGLCMSEKYYDDTLNNVFPYLKIIYSNPADSQGNALGLGNVKKAPYLNIFPEEFIGETSFVVDWAKATLAKDPEDQGEEDYLYIAGEFSNSYSRLQELVRGRLK